LRDRSATRREPIGGWGPERVETGTRVLKKQKNSAGWVLPKETGRRGVPKTKKRAGFDIKKKPGWV